MFFCLFVWKRPSYSWVQDLFQMVTSFHFCLFTLLFTCVHTQLFLIHMVSLHHLVFENIFLISSRDCANNRGMTAASRNRLFWKRCGILWMFHCEEGARCDPSEEWQQNKHKHMWDVWLQPTEISASWSLLKESYFHVSFHPTKPSITHSFQATVIIYYF